MVRVSPEERLTAIAEAATRVFGRLGYRGTRTAQVAAGAGISSGSIFNYVESKEALFHLVFAHGFGQFAERIPNLPLATPSRGETVRLIEDELRKMPVPKLRAALEEDAPVDIRRELSGIVEERYEMLGRLWPLLAVIERCAMDVPELEEFYFRGARVRYFARLAQYLEQRAASGYMRQMPDTAVAARIISESIVWFTWKRREGRDPLLYDDDVVKRTVVEFICAALVGEPPG